MKRVCAWCGADLADRESPEGSVPVSHGICQACLEALTVEHAAEGGAALGQFLESLGVPVLAVDADGVVLEASRAAREMLGREREAVVGFRGGDILECVKARLPGGCGASEYCRAGCVIRRSVTSTAATGRPVVRAAAEQEVLGADGLRTVRVWISTERIGGAVLLRIDGLEQL